MAQQIMRMKPDQDQKPRTEVEWSSLSSMPEGRAFVEQYAKTRQKNSYIYYIDRYALVYYNN